MIAVESFPLQISIGLCRVNKIYNKTVFEYTIVVHIKNNHQLGHLYVIWYLNIFSNIYPESFTIIINTLCEQGLTQQA